MLTQKIGLMCGTFDPPHIGHLILAQTALVELALDQVLFLPVGDPTHKTTYTSAEHRLNMTRLAIQDNLAFVLDSTDAMRPGPHYTATLLPLIQEKYPESTLWLLLGGDSLNSFPDWYRPDSIITQCRLAVLDRPKHQTDVTSSKMLNGAVFDKIDNLSGPSVDLSSTWLRANFGNGSHHTRYLISSLVDEYIIKNKLYKE
ncbi:MAG: nicotinate-nucleotide adenylyltransferase [Cellvibrionaceae bacterium]|jgi:nicotinate-nucleotide adenylyltransferase